MRMPWRLFFTVLFWVWMAYIFWALKMPGRYVGLFVFSILVYGAHCSFNYDELQQRRRWRRD